MFDYTLIKYKKTVCLPMSDWSCRAVSEGIFFFLPVMKQGGPQRGWNSLKKVGKPEIYWVGSSGPSCRGGQECDEMSLSRWLVAWDQIPNFAGCRVKIKNAQRCIGQHSPSLSLLYEDVLFSSGHPRDATTHWRQSLNIIDDLAELDWEFH